MPSLTLTCQTLRSPPSDPLIVVDPFLLENPAV
jgi:hypothetical protein